MSEFKRFDSYVEQGLISKKISPCGKLVLFDYTEKCQYEKAWDDITLNARGSVYELSTGKLVARAFSKFFNYGELTPAIQIELSNKTFTVDEKLDGSLGIIYFYDGKWRVNTRGSFVSDQAIIGAQLLEEQASISKMEEDLTYLVEIIYPENRVVVDYKGLEALVLLAVVNTETGEEYPKSDYLHIFNFDSKTYSFSNITELMIKLKELSFNEEGYVVKFSNGTRVKFKGDEYVKMHRIVTGTSPLTLWESMKQGKVCEVLMSGIPEEFRQQYEEMAEKLEFNYSVIQLNVNNYMSFIYSNVLNDDEITPESRKTLGLYLKENPSPISHIIFPFFLKKPETVDLLIKKEIKPKANIL